MKNQLNISMNMLKSWRDKLLMLMSLLIKLTLMDQFNTTQTYNRLTLLRFIRHLTHTLCSHSQCKLHKY